MVWDPEFKGTIQPIPHPAFQYSTYIILYSVQYTVLVSQLFILGNLSFVIVFNEVIHLKEKVSQNCIM